MDFKSLGLNNDIVKILTELGYSTPTEIQQKAIPHILNGKDVVGRSETGSGKTFAFALPIIQNINNVNNIQSLVVCPTRELAMQVADEFKKIAQTLNIKVCAVFGGSNLDRQINAVKKNPEIVVGTPGRLIDLLKRKALNLSMIKTVVLDEADEMLDMGFREDIEKILKFSNKLRQTVLFSATIPDEIKEIISNYQTDSVFIEIGQENKAIDKIDQHYLFVEQKYKKDTIKELFWTDVFGRTIVFVNTKRYAEELESFLNKNKISAKALHGDMRQGERKRVIDGYKQGKFDILIATDVASRGIDIKNVKYVVNYDLPQQLEYYVHRIGRTARAGESGQVVNLITNLSQLSYMKEIEKQTGASIGVYQTNNDNLQMYFVDTKKLAKKTNRFISQNKFQQEKRVSKKAEFMASKKQKENKQNEHKKEEKFKPSYKNKNAEKSKKNNSKNNFLKDAKKQGKINNKQNNKKIASKTEKSKSGKQQKVNLKKSSKAGNKDNKKTNKWYGKFIKK